MLSKRERWRRLTGLDIEGPHPDCSRERTLFYLELVHFTTSRKWTRCRTCRACLRFDADDCENCDYWRAHLLSGPDSQDT
jgi:hypothetical protein